MVNSSPFSSHYINTQTQPIVPSSQGDSLWTMSEFEAIFLREFSAVGWKPRSRGKLMRRDDRMVQV